MPESIDDYIDRGIHGAKEINPAERKKYLGTFRERIEIQMSKQEVFEKYCTKELEQEMKDHPKAKLLLNGSISYEILRAYIMLAEKHKLPFSIVAREDDDTPVGLVLTEDHEINREDTHLHETPAVTEDTTGKVTLLDKIRAIFKE
ncbi:YueI family protein [Listeria booriae]|uniref:YueI family protein n=1 Tax=Listeria booriae TaxID=1552123 RepID=A0A7X0Z6J0_9LIST|nr:YueI family protein [Listeria booriae]MBC2176894.1 YueI family protein [Listeria booriae]